MIRQARKLSQVNTSWNFKKSNLFNVTWLILKLIIETFYTSHKYTNSPLTLKLQWKKIEILETADIETTTTNFPNVI